MDEVKTEVRRLKQVKYRCTCGATWLLLNSKRGEKLFCRACMEYGGLEEMKITKEV